MNKIKCAHATSCGQLPRRLMSFPVMRIGGIACLLLWLVMVIAALITYDGSKLCYITFSVVFLGLLFSGLYAPSSYSYLFFSVMLWLGFWAKFTYHTIFHLPYQESIGAFVATPEALDRVLWVASVGCLGILSALLYDRWQVKSRGLSLSLPNPVTVPKWYSAYRRYWLLLLILSMGAALAINFKWDIFLVGVVPKTILLWPMNALFTWLLTIGFALMISTVMWWDMQLKQALNSGYMVQLLEALSMSCAILSRALYIFHVIPAALSWYLHRQSTLTIKRKKIVQLIVLSVVLFFVSLQSVSILRSHYHDGMVWNRIDVKAPFFVKIFNQLVIDRWLGVEGVMAISSYPHLGWQTFKEALLEKAEIGKVGIYQKIAQSHYQYIDNKRLLFATLPGLLGFIYLTGSLLCVLAGAFCLTAMMMWAERWVRILTGNPFLCALFAMTIANTMAQFGVTPLLVLKQYLLIYLYVFVIAAIQQRQRWWTWLSVRFSSQMIRST